MPRRVPTIEQALMAPVADLAALPMRPLPEFLPGSPSPPFAPAITNPLVPASASRPGKLLPSSLAEARAGLAEAAPKVVEALGEVFGPRGGLVKEVREVGEDIAEGAFRRFGYRAPDVLGQYRAQTEAIRLRRAREQKESGRKFK